jgi:hypothetical protein
MFRNFTQVISVKPSPPHPVLELSPDEGGDHDYLAVF